MVTILSRCGSDDGGRTTVDWLAVWVKAYTCLPLWPSLSFPPIVPVLPMLSGPLLSPLPVPLPLQRRKSCVGLPPIAREVEGVAMAAKEWSAWEHSGRIR